MDTNGQINIFFDYNKQCLIATEQQQFTMRYNLYDQRNIALVYGESDKDGNEGERKMRN